MSDTVIRLKVREDTPVRVHRDTIPLRSYASFVDSDVAVSLGDVTFEGEPEDVLAAVEAVAHGVRDVIRQRIEAQLPDPLHPVPDPFAGSAA